ncbi:ribbon-helix-helix protein, CopG family [Candidatus Binatia bacterium]|jgi:plasmid stability protein|nr:ribbon-helix-helix protein, CopG family [Candidatus Binatia bacterium]
MGSAKRATVYLDPDLHRAVRVKAAETERSVSELLNEALRQSLAEDAEDLEAVRSRSKEPSLDFERVLKDLRRRGKL